MATHYTTASSSNSGSYIHEPLSRDVRKVAAEVAGVEVRSISLVFLTVLFPYTRPMLVYQMRTVASKFIIRDIIILPVFSIAWW